MGDLVQPSICHMAAWVGERCPPHINPEVGRVRKLPLLSLAATLGRDGPAPSVGSTIEPTSLAEVWMSQPQSCKLSRAVPITHLSCGGMGRGEMSSPYVCLRQRGELALRSERQKNCSCLSSVTTLKRRSPVLMSNTREPIL